MSLYSWIKTYPLTFPLDLEVTYTTISHFYQKNICQHDASFGVLLITQYALHFVESQQSIGIIRKASEELHFPETL